MCLITYIDGDSAPDGKVGQLQRPVFFPISECRLILNRTEVGLCVQNVLKVFGDLSCERIWSSESLVQSIFFDFILNLLPDGTLFRRELGAITLEILNDVLE